MMSSIHTKSFVASLVGALALAAPAAGSVLEPTLVSDSHGQDRSATIVLHRDGSQATPFVAQVGPPAASTSSTTTSSDGFDWGDAAVGAGTALVATALLVGGSSALSGRRSSRSSKAVSPASQGA